MRFQFEVKADKLYSIDYYRNEFFGTITVRANGIIVWSNKGRLLWDTLKYLSRLPMGRRSVPISAFPDKMSETTAFKIGEGKVYQIYINRDVDRKGGFFAKTNYQVFVDYSLSCQFHYTPGRGEKIWKLSMIICLFLIGIIYVFKTRT